MTSESDHEGIILIVAFLSVFLQWVAKGKDFCFLSLRVEKMAQTVSSLLVLQL